MKPVLVGAVVYDPKVTIIWDIIARFFESRGFPIDIVYYTNYELQVTSLLEGHIDIAWNSPLAWLDAQHRSGGTCRAIAMRDTDRDRVSHALVLSDSPYQSLGGLRGTPVAFGAKDSPQATLIPIGCLAESGLQPDVDYTPLKFDVLVGKHGDHVGGERDALQALIDGKAAASWCLDLNWQLWSSDGTADPSRVRILATTPLFDHCVFTVREGFDETIEKDFLEHLLAMDYSNPEHKEMMDMEGLKQWELGRTTGFEALNRGIAVVDYWA